MDIFGIGILVVVSLLGGGIALFADRLGRTLGKKRLSVLGMRPRKTAEVLTFIAGVLIPLLTVGLIMLAFSEVRRWFAEGPNALVQRDQLATEVLGLKKRGDQLDKDILAKTAEAQGLDNQLKTTRAQVEKYKVEVSKLVSQAAEAVRRVALLKGQVQKLTLAYKATQTNLVAAEGSLKGAKSSLASLRTSYATLDTQRSEAFDQSRLLTNQNDQLEKDIDAAKANIAKLNAQSADVKAAFDKTKADLDGQLDAKKRELERAAIELDQVNAELANTHKLLQQIGPMTLNARTQPMIFRLGEELARLPISPGLAAQSAKTEVARLLRASRILAEERGAKRLGSVPAAGFTEREINGVTVSPEAQETSLAQRLTGLSENTVVIATSTFNAFLGEPVSVDVRWMKNPIVFQKGDLIAEARINGEAEQDAILKQISAFLTGAVRSKAKSIGMIAVAGKEESFGEVPTETILGLVKLIRDHTRTVRLLAFAEAQTRAADPLKITFQVR